MYAWLLPTLFVISLWALWRLTKHQHAWLGHTSTDYPVPFCACGECFDWPRYRREVEVNGWHLPERIDRALMDADLNARLLERAREALRSIDEILREGLDAWPKIGDRAEFARWCLQEHRTKAFCDGCIETGNIVALKLEGRA